MSVQTSGNWYNAARVREPGSVVLRDWLASRPGGRDRAGVRADSSNRYSLTDRPAMQELFTMPTYAGPAVTAYTSMQVTAVYACIALIAGAIASLPFAFYERTDDVDGRKRVKHPLWWLFNEEPSPLLPAAVFWEYVTTTRYLHRDGFAMLVRNRAGTIIEALPLSPLEVEPMRDGNRMIYAVNAPDLGKPFALNQDDMLHFFGFGFSPSTISGGRTHRSMSMIGHIARQAIGTALASDEFSARFFANGAQPSHVIKYPGPVTEEAIQALRNRWAEKNAGLVNAHKPLVLTHNAELKELSINPEDAQLLESRRFQVEDIARAFGVPPFMIGATDKVTSWGTGVEAMGQGFVRFTLMRELRRMEQEINRKVFRTSRYFGEFNVDALQRGDLKTRGEYYRQAVGGSQGPGWMVVNEIRSKENLEPIEGADKLYNPTPQQGGTDAPAKQPTPPADPGQPRRAPAPGSEGGGG